MNNFSNNPLFQRAQQMAQGKSEKELEQTAANLCEQLNGTGYDSVAIHNMQDKYHEKYKKKYNEEYTDKEVRKLKEQNKRK